MTGEAKMRISIEQQLRQYADAYQELQDASNAHAAIDRTVTNFDEIVESRQGLDRKRHKARLAASDVVSHHEYPAPDPVKPGQRHGISTRGKWGAALGVLALLAAVVALVAVAFLFTRPDPITVDGAIIEDVTDCVWRLTVPLVNNGDMPIEVRRVEVLVERKPLSIWLPRDSLVLDPGAHAEIDAGHRMVPCPASAGDVEHGELRVIWQEAGASARAVGEVMRHKF